GRAAAAVRDWRAGRWAAGELPLPVSLLHRRPDVRRGGTATRFGHDPDRSHPAHRWLDAERAMSTEGTKTKEPPESAALRATPRPVMRLNRRTLATVVGVSCAAVLGATLWSLQSASRNRGSVNLELHNVDRVSKAEGLGQLPADYSKLAPAASVPVLGPPLPGDLSRPMLRAESGQGSLAGRPMGYDEQANVERVSRAREAEEAAKAPVIFKQGSRTPLVNGQAAALA